MKNTFAMLTVIGAIVVLSQVPVYHDSVHLFLLKWILLVVGFIVSTSVIWDDEKPYAAWLLAGAIGTGYMAINQECWSTVGTWFQHTTGHNLLLVCALWGVVTPIIMSTVIPFIKDVADGFVAAQKAAAK